MLESINLEKKLKMTNSAIILWIVKEILAILFILFSLIDIDFSSLVLFLFILSLVAIFLFVLQVFCVVYSTKIADSAILVILILGFFISICNIVGLVLLKQKLQKIEDDFYMTNINNFKNMK